MTKIDRETPPFRPDGQQLCAQVDPELFFPKGAPTDAVRDICRRCPVKTECLEHALHWNVLGVWGGTSFAERQRMAAARGISPLPLLAAGALDVHTDAANAKRAQRARAQARADGKLVERRPDCGTHRGYVWHVEHSEEPCTGCKTKEHRHQQQIASRRARVARRRAALQAERVADLEALPDEVRAADPSTWWSPEQQQQHRAAHGEVAA